MIKFYPHLFFNPVSKKMSTPPPRLSTPHLKKNVDPPTSFWTIRTLGIRGQKASWFARGNSRLQHLEQNYHPVKHPLLTPRNPSLKPHDGSHSCNLQFIRTESRAIHAGRITSDL